MSLKNKFISSYKKSISWLKNTRIKQLQNDVIQLHEDIKNIYDDLNQSITLIQKESNIKSSIKKELTKCIKEYKATQEDSYIVGLEQRVNNIVDDLSTSIKSKEDHLLDIMSGCRKVITELNMAENDFLEVKILGDKAKRKYQVYVDSIEKEFKKYGDMFVDKILQFQENDAATRRLASIEERCTLLELKLK